MVAKNALYTFLIVVSPKDPKQTIHMQQLLKNTSVQLPNSSQLNTSRRLTSLWKIRHKLNLQKYLRIQCLYILKRNALSASVSCTVVSGSFVVAVCIQCVTRKLGYSLHCIRCARNAAACSQIISTTQYRVLLFRVNLYEDDVPIKTVVANLVGLPLYQFLANQHTARRTNFEYKYYVQIFAGVIHRTIRKIYCITFILFHTFRVLAIIF